MSLKQRIRDGARLATAFVPVPSPEIVEIAAYSGFDIVVFDAEHGPLDMADIRHMLRAAQAADIPALVRVPVASKDFVGRVLDAGADGILVPQIETPEEAAAAVREAHHPPLGQRGAAFYARANQFTKRGGWAAIDHAAANTVVGIMIETPRGIAAASAIAAVEGVDFVVIGTNDLSVSIGRTPRAEEEVRAAIEVGRRLATEEGRRVGIPGTDTASALAYAKSPFTIVAIGLVPLLVREASAVARAMREAAGEAS